MAVRVLFFGIDSVGLSGRERDRQRERERGREGERETER
jgi:hypothetical protein